MCGNAPDVARSLDIEHVDNKKENDDPENLRLACHACNMTKENIRRTTCTLGGVPVRQLARELDVSTTYLYKVVDGKKPPSKKILDWVKLNKKDLVDTRSKRRTSESTKVELARSKRRTSGPPQSRSPKHQNERVNPRGIRVCVRKQENTGIGTEEERERTEGKPGTRIVRQVVDYSDARAPVTMQANSLYEVDFREWLLKTVRERRMYLKADAVNAGAEMVGCSPETAKRYIAKLASPTGPLRETKDKVGGWMLTFREVEIKGKAGRER